MLKCVKMYHKYNIHARICSRRDKMFRKYVKNTPFRAGPQV